MKANAIRRHPIIKGEVWAGDDSSEPKPGRSGSAHSPVCPDTGIALRLSN
jgi:hypothetical protein